MKHAIIILAHKDLENLPHLIEYFQHDCYIYIHIDKWSKDENGNRTHLNKQTLEYFKEHNDPSFTQNNLV